MKYLLGEKLHFDWKVVTITIISTLLLIINYYHKFTANIYWDRVILYLFAPLIVILLFFRENPKEYGFSLRDWNFIDGTHHILFGPRRSIDAEVLQALYRRLTVDDILGPRRLGVSLPWLDPVWLCAPIWARGIVVASGSFCDCSHRQARSGDSLHNLRWLCLRLDCLPD